MADSYLEILPLPFVWISIPNGKVKMHSEGSKEIDSYIPNGTAQIFDVSSFEIAKYPLTNGQFAKFIEANGYNHRHLWTDEGWYLKEQNRWTEPLFWDNPKFNEKHYPVVGVSWYESIAFCNWLSNLAGENISLPTEQQWQYAAQGNTDRTFAWGNEFDKNRFNWNSEGLTPVTQYEGKGDSPFGVVDMSGNVWEWCLTKGKTGKNDLNGTDSRIARGGGWAMLYSHTLNFRVTDRMYLLPHHRLDYLGLRCVRLSC